MTRAVAARASASRSAVGDRHRSRSAPLIFTDYYLSQILTKALWLGIAAVEPHVPRGLRRDGVARPDGTVRHRGLHDGEPRHSPREARDLRWNPWVGVDRRHRSSRSSSGSSSARSRAAARASTSSCSRSRSAILAFYFFGQVNDLSGFGGLNQVDVARASSEPARQDPNRSLLHRRSSSRSSSTC